MVMKTNYAFKALHLNNKDEMISAFDESPWKMGEWREVEGPIEPCINGFHFTKLRGSSWLDGEILAIAEIGKERLYSERSDAQWQKGVARKMRIVKVLDIASIIEDLSKEFDYEERDIEADELATLRLYFLMIDAKSRAPAVLKRVLELLAPEYL
jgi:hypothetical protein